MKTIALLAVGCLVAVCASDTKQWSYKTTDPSVYPPAQWGLYEPACDGTHQSPISIETKSYAYDLNSLRTESPLSFAGTCSQATIMQYDDAFKAFATKQSTCKVQISGHNKTFNFVQSHYHAPAEHAINGRVYDAEIHFVHTSPHDGNLVVGLFVEKRHGADTDPYLLKFLESVQSVDTHKNVTAEVSLGSFFPAVETSLAAGRVFNYPGSLTNPPCAESVDWWVVEKPLVVSPSDFEKMHKELLRLSTADEGKTARPVQALNGRTITVYVTL